MRYLIFGSLIFAMTACGTTKKKGGDVNVTYTAQMINDHPQWIASTDVIPANSTIHATLMNQLDVPHGFSIPGLQAPVVIDPGATVAVQFSTKAPGSYQAECPLHQSHLPAVINVQ